MPDYFLDYIDLPSMRRDVSKKSKIYRNRRGLCGPTLICKYVYGDDSFPDYYNYIASDGKLENYENKAPYSSLKVASRLALPSFSLPYSVNKQKRWTVFENLRKSITDLQDREIKLRVTLARSRLECFQRHYDNPEERATCTHSADLIEELYGYNGGTKIELIEGNMKFSDITSHTETRNKGKKKRLGRLFRSYKAWTPVLPGHDYFTHVFIKEYRYVCTPGIINTGSRKYKDMQKPRGKHCFPQRDDIYEIYNYLFNYDYDWRDALKERLERKLQRKRRRLVKNRWDNYWHEDISSESSDELSDGEDETFAKPSVEKEIPLSIYFRWKIKRPLKRRRRKRRMDDWSEEYKCWYEGRKLVEQHLGSSDETEKSQYTETQMYAPLPQFTISSCNTEPFRSVMKLFGRSKRIDGLIPEVYVVDLSTDESRRLKFLDLDFKGIAVMRTFKRENDTEIRISFNANHLKEAEKRVSPKKENLTSTEFFKDYADETPTVCSSENAKAVAFERLCNRVVKKELDLHVVFPQCSVCETMDDDGFALRCGHYACRNCWMLNAFYQIQALAVPISCVEYGCDEILTPEQMLTFVPQVACEQYKMLLCNKEFMKPEWIECSRCSKMLHLERMEQKWSIVLCECGEFICTGCKENIHLPLTCNEAQLYSSALQITDATSLEGMTVRVKKCPMCHNYCERSDGCDHMTCTCGAEFCYRCGKDWSSITHWECEEDFNNVDLIDVPRKLHRGVPMKALLECLRLRADYSQEQCEKIAASISKILGPDNTSNDAYMKLYRTGYKLLELTTFKIALLKKKARHSRNSKQFLTAANKLRTRRNGLLFYFGRLKQILDLRSMRLKHLDNIRMVLEKTLRKCIDDALS